MLTITCLGLSGPGGCLGLLGRGKGLGSGRLGIRVEEYTCSWERIDVQADTIHSDRVITSRLDYYGLRKPIHRKMS